jgi:hypothetical protein
MTNSIRPLSEQCLTPAFHPAKRVEKLMIKINVRLLMGAEVFGRYAAERDFCELLNGLKKKLRMAYLDCKLNSVRPLTLNGG